MGGPTVVFPARGPRASNFALSVEAGPPGIQIVSERLGHATVGFTLDVFGHVMPGQQADAAAAVAALVDA